MSYAVIQTGGKQYKVTPGQVIEVDNLKTGAEKNVTFENVLLTVNDGKVEVGTPTVNGVVVTGKVVANFKGDKVRVAKFRAKSRHRRVNGFRAQLTRVQIEDISTSKKATTKK